MRGYTDAFQQVFTCLHKYINSRTTVPVRVTRRIVAILRSQTSIPAIVQVRKTPRAANPGGVGTVESRSRACIPFLFSFPVRCVGVVLPLWSAYADHSPRFLPAPQSRGRLLQFEPPGAAAPLSAARPASPPLCKPAKRHGQRTPAEVVPQKADLK